MDSRSHQQAQQHLQPQQQQQQQQLQLLMQPSLAQHGCIVPELYFLIAKFLSHGPLASAGALITAELERQHILPTRLDWLGRPHAQSFAELERKYSHISPHHLLQICARIPALLERSSEAQPAVAGISSLLGAGRQSVLRTVATTLRAKTLRDHCTRQHAMPVPESAQRRPNNNIVHVLLGRQAAGPLVRRLCVTTEFYDRMLLQRRTLGHLSAVYCVLFDRSGKYIITGADDLLVKLWSAIDGRLLTTFRGASAEITDIAVNLDNTLLAAGSLDRILRVWDLQTAGPIAVLSGHTGMITSVNFCPSPRAELKYLVTTSTDGSVAFWQYGTPRGGKAQFAAKPIQYHEKLRPGQAQMICASFSPGGVFLAAGSADHHVRVYLMAEEGPRRILETEAHKDTVDSIQWAHSGLRFVSGSKDGMAHVWHFEAQQWRPLKLNMSDRLASCPVPEDESRKLKVTMVSWDFSDRWVITAVNDFTIKVWNASTGKLHRVMRGHTDELFVLESHPKDPHVLISAGHDGQLFVWNILAGVAITSFCNNIDGQGHGGVFDAKWSPDGSMIAATDSHGHILMYGFGAGHPRLKLLPKELFFHTDYRPLVRDVNHYVMDEQTQTIPHLMPPPFLVDVDGNPHPPRFQRLVPGRETCTTEQLVPNITMGPEGMEVVDSTAVSHIDRMIAVLANRSGAAPAAQPNGGEPGVAAAAVAGGAGMPAPAANQQQQQPQRPPSVVGASPRSLNNAVRVEAAGVRQSSGNWERTEQNFKWMRRTYVRPMQYSRLQALRQSTYVVGQQEQEHYKREMRRRPMMINTGGASSASLGGGGAQSLRPAHSARRRPVRQSRAAAAGGAAGAGAGASAASSSSQPTASGSGANGSGAAAGSGAPTPAYRTRAVRGRENPPTDDNSDDPDHMASASSDDSNDSTAQEDLMSGMSSSSADSDSSDYSDWVANDQPGQALEPPKRSKRKPVHSRRFSPSPSSSDAGGEAGADAAEDGVNAGASTSRGAAAASRATNGRGGRRPAATNGTAPVASTSSAAAAAASTSRPSPPATAARAGARTASGGRSRRSRRAPQRIQPIFENGEIPERYRPPEWLSEVIPRKAPYYPQMGDDVVYFRQGHQRYLDAVRTKKVYKLPNNCEPWQQLDLRDHEPVKVIGIKYEIRPPRLCCLKLALLNNNGSLTGQSFTIKYHDMPDVLDFIVLWQTYETAVRRLWTPGDRFRCMIDDSWWTGGIESRTALCPEFPTSLFMCFRTRWDNGEFEAMSPWDMEPIDQLRLPEEVGGQVAVTAEELRATLYQPKSEEWPRGDRDATCRRIVAGLDEVMGLAIADPFLVPVDLNSYPSYAFMVEYPIDLTTIKARFENHFYRRLTSAQFDVRYLATNAEKFNQSNSSIVKHARIITDLCLRIIKDQNEVDVGAVYHQLMDTYVTSDSDADTEVGSSARPSTSRAASAIAEVASRSAVASTSRGAAAGSSASGSQRRATRARPAEDWQTKCRDLLELIWARDDSTPFREPVDLIEHPDYLASVDTPMDLRTVKEDLLGGNYHTIGEFVNDMRTIFSNSRNYNTNKRSRIYSMTLRLSNLFEAQLKAVTKSAAASRSSGSSAKRRQAGGGGGERRSGGSAELNSPPASRRRRTHQSAGTVNGGAGPSGLQSASSSQQQHHHQQQQSALRSGAAHPSSTDDDDDEVDVLSNWRRISATGPGSTSTASSSATAAAALAASGTGRSDADGAMPGPSGGQSSRTLRRHQQLAVAGSPPGSAADLAAGQTNGGGTRRAQRGQPAQQQQAAGGRQRQRRRVHDEDDDDDDEEDEDEEEEEDDSDASSADTSSSDDVLSPRHNRRQSRGTKPRNKRRRIVSESLSLADSEESYNPGAKRRAKSRGEAVKRKPVAAGQVNGGSAVAGPSGVSRRKPAASAAAAAAMATSDDEEDDDEYNAHEEEEEEEEEEDADDANDSDYNCSRTPKKTPARQAMAAAAAGSGASASKSSPRKTAARSANANHQQVAAATDPLLSSSGSDDNNGRRRSARKPQPETDHSYHLNASAGSSGGAGSHRRRIQLDSDDATAEASGAAPELVEELSQDGSVRPRRAVQQRMQQQQQQQQQDVAAAAASSRATARRPARRPRSGDSDSLDDPLSSLQPATTAASQNSNSSSAATAAPRSTRSTRSAVSQEEDDDDETAPTADEDSDDDDDDQVLSQLSNGNRSRRNGHHPDTPQPASQASSTASSRPNRLAAASQPRPSTPASDAARRTAVRSQVVQDDHNYGDPGPATMRHSRRVAASSAAPPPLSRHQRNADELDSLHSEEQHQPIGRLRQRAHPAAAPSSSQEAGATHRLRRTTTSQENNDDDDDGDNDSADSDDDDDKPLRFMTTSQTSATTSTSTSNSQTSRQPPRLSRQQQQQQPAAQESTSRSTRTQKRPYYNEDTDNEEERRPAAGSAAASASAASHPPAKRPAIAANSQQYAGVPEEQEQEEDEEVEEEDDDDDDYNEDDETPLVRRHVNADGEFEAGADDDLLPDGRSNGDDDAREGEGDEDEDTGSEPSISVSSRGRVRRITAKARGMFRE